MSSQSSSRSATTSPQRGATQNVADHPLGNPPPSTHTWEELLKRWQFERLTTEQAIGQLLLWGKHLHAELVATERRQIQLQNQITELQRQVMAQADESNCLTAEVPNATMTR